MARRLNTYVHVHVDGISQVYGPEDKIPGAVAALITNPAVWEGADAEEVDDADKVPAPQEPEEVPAEAAPADAAKIPPKSGRGSGVPAWRDYADRNGFEMDDDVTREEIISALEEAGIPTEK
ncbi:MULTISPECIES: hypothetical protein [unclassified Microbacterium]|uniref:hypothetical protein n=1 Tax=unclassified Microbacterium TaxID=2609290 RepID=UPI0038635DA5